MFVVFFFVLSVCFRFFFLLASTTTPHDSFRCDSLMAQLSSAVTTGDISHQIPPHRAPYSCIWVRPPFGCCAKTTRPRAVRVCLLSGLFFLSVFFPPSFRLSATEQLHLRPPTHLLAGFCRMLTQRRRRASCCTAWGPGSTRVRQCSSSAPTPYAQRPSSRWSRGDGCRGSPRPRSSP